MDIEKVVERLESLGYEYHEHVDSSFLEFAVEKAENHILNNINQSSIPDGLINIAIDMACGEFLKIQKGFGRLSCIEFEQIAQTVKLGDTNIQFANNATPEQQFDDAISYLIYDHEDDFARYRRLVW